MRLFVAVDPGERVRHHLTTWLDEGRRRWPLRWVRPGTLHLTLQFLGEQPERDVGPLQQALRGAVADLAPIPVVPTGIGAFPGWSRPRVLVLHLDGGPALAALGEAVRSATAPVVTGDRPDAKPLRPHLTLARLREPLAPDDLAALRRWRPALPPAFTVDRIALVESVLGHGGARYRDVDVFPLAGETTA